MALALSQLDFEKAFHYNGFVLLLIPYGVFAYIRHNLSIVRGKPYQYKKYHKHISYVLLVLALAYGILRNIPYFYFLRPY